MPLPSKVSETVRRMNPHIFGGSPVQGAPVVAAGKRLRQDPKPLLNKLETRFLEEVLKLEFPSADIHAQDLRLRLANGLWYKVDFFLPATKERGALAFEVKGPKAFRGGFENLKMAAAVHGLWLTFFLVWQDEDDGRWMRQEILP